MTQTPDWPTCVHADGCWGIRWGDGEVCLAHLGPSALDEALAALRPGSSLDLRGTTIAPALLDWLLEALAPDEENAPPIIETARFTDAQFSGDAGFRDAQFNGNVFFDGTRFSGDAGFGDAQFNGYAGFRGARFSGYAGFRDAQFNGNTEFKDARFSGPAWFEGAQFSSYASFERAEFSGSTGFGGAQFNGYTPFTRAQFSRGAGFEGAQFSGLAAFTDARFIEGTSFERARFSRSALFGRAQFSGHTVFDGAQFSGEASFKEAQFSQDVRFNRAHFDGLWGGPMICRGVFSAAGVTMMWPVRVQVEAARVLLAESRFTAPAVFAVRNGAVDLTDVAAGGPITITSHPDPFTVFGRVRPFTAARHGWPADEPDLSGDARASVTSLAGADAASIVLSDVDLSRCVFSGGHHLDQIRLEGRCTFAEAPRGWSRTRIGIPARRWTRRKVLAEEAAWRAALWRRAPGRSGWTNPGGQDSPVPVQPPAQLAVLYRQLRKALEDGKDTPGAADFYYGEMEARRHDREGTPRAERALLHAYWLLSGYALRASRALGFLAVTATATFLLLLAVGLPDNQLDPQIIGTLPPAGKPVALTQSTPDPTLTIPLNQRFSAARADQAGLVVVNSVIFRSTDTTLTKSGTWIEIISRIGEPILLGFAAVAARGRVQR